MKNKFLSRNFQPRLFLFLFFGFIFATVAGTVSHEGGHYIAGRVMGYDARIHYGYTSFPKGKPIPEYIEDIRQKYEPEIYSGAEYPGKEQYDTYFRNRSKAYFWLTAGGPLQTMLTGTIGLLALFVERKKYADAKGLPPARWLLIFLSLFWLRQFANWFSWMADFLLSGSFSGGGDEIRLAIYAGLPEGLILTLTSILGIGVLAIVLFRFIPRSNRLTFIAAGLAGGVCGYFVWLEALGPLLLP